MKLTQLLKENEDRGLTSEVKKHFLEIVSTYNKYQESMERKSDIIEVAETLGGITEAARELALREADAIGGFITLILIVCDSVSDPPGPEAVRSIV